MNQGTLEQRYDIYCSCANDGTGRDTTTGSRTWLKTFDQWLDGIEGDPAPAEELTPEGIQLVITGAERITAPTEADKQGQLW